MYYYPDNLLESVLILQKRKFNYKSIDEDMRQRSRKQLEEYLQKNRKWHLNLWEITNVLPNSKREKGIAAFPHELADRLIRLYSYEGETVLDCFCGSGTSMKAALELGRNSIGIEIDSNLLPVIKEKIESSKRMKPAVAQLIVITRLKPHGLQYEALISCPTNLPILPIRVIPPISSSSPTSLPQPADSVGSTIPETQLIENAILKVGDR